MEFDVIVVGAGAVGGSIAYELSTRGLNVCRVGETDRTNAASRAAGAMNGCFGEVNKRPAGK
ncbi:FAD-dependent oxidoreductase [Pseudomonas sp. GL-B-26]|uniref:FAD-dependent oxidoreductase n=1 Tax=Pseudomonas sp. GL-B-26 TaxID=2832394 RepID=UPI0021D8B585|nr:FAD-dependent oxidoreductase [Pseudomonas sp. GL-B-26]